MGNKPPSINIIIYCIGEVDDEIINRLFPKRINQNVRKVYFKDENKKEIFYLATISNQLNEINEIINNNINENDYKNIILCFPNKNQNHEINAQHWNNLIRNFNNTAEVNLPFIILLNYNEPQEVKNYLLQNNYFNNFKDKRKITILNLDRRYNDNDKAGIIFNYKKIFSYLWIMNQILNQKPFKPSQHFDANLYVNNLDDPPASIKILLTGFSREGKSTFINLAFDKIVSYESPSLNSTTQNIIEFFKPSSHDPNNNGVVLGGIKFIDVPGLIPGNNDNKNAIIKLIKDSILQLEKSIDIINYILFFLKPGIIFTEHIDDFLRTLNTINIHVIFVINRVQVSDVTKETLIDYLRRKNFNNLLKDNGGNILEVDIINGVNNRSIKEIFSYIHNDLISKNTFNVEEINNIQDDNEIIDYLHQNSNLFSRILSTRDFINKAKKKSNFIANSSAVLISITGFNPIPFVDIPIYLFIFAMLLIKIFQIYGFTINMTNLRLFFNRYSNERAILEITQNDQNINEQGNENNENIQLVNNLNRMNNIANNGILNFINNQLIRALGFRMTINTTTGFLHFIPIFGTIISGVIDIFVNIPFLYKLVKEAQDFCENKINENGIKTNILNQINGYKSSFEEINILANKTNWSRKLNFQDNFNQGQLDIEII